MFNMSSFFYSSCSFKLFSVFLRIIFLSPFSQLICQQERISSQEDIQIYHNCSVGTRKWKKSYMLSTLSLKYLLQNLPRWILPGKETFFFFFFFLVCPWQSQKCPSLKYKLYVHPSYDLYSFFQLSSHSSWDHNSQATVLSLKDWAQALPTIMHHEDFQNATQRDRISDSQLYLQALILVILDL